jgi:transposase
MNYCGIDLHSNNCVVIVSDDSDRIVYQKRLPNELAQLAAALEPYRHELTGVIVESTYNWYWLVDGLMDSGYRVHLAHPAAIRKYDGLKHSGDSADGVSGEAAEARVAAQGLCLSAREPWRATWRASACNWCVIALHRSFQSRAS